MGITNKLQLISKLFEEHNELRAFNGVRGAF